MPTNSSKSIITDPDFPLEAGQIVQLHPSETRNLMFAACLMTVTEIKSWGVQGYVQSLGKNGEIGGQAYYRAKWGEFFVTGGRAPFVVQSDE